MDDRMVLSNLKVVELKFLVTVDNEVTCHVTLRIPRDDPRAKNVLRPINVRCQVKKQRVFTLPDCVE